MKNIISVIVFTIINFTTLSAQDSKIIDTTFRVYGNCEQCKTRIEKAVKIDEVKYAKWNKTTKMLKVVFENSITSDSLQKRIAAIGHDTDKYKASSETYIKLPNCCLYRDKSKTH